MSSQALFNILYQNDTLYQLHDCIPLKKEVIQETITEEVPISQIAIVKPAPTQAVVKPEIVVVAKEITQPPVEKFPVLKHKILILFDEPENKQMPQSEALFLDNILKAVKSSSSSADIINAGFLKNPDAGNVLSEKLTENLISFGVPLARLHLDLFLVPYTPKLVDGIWFLSADSLTMIEGDRDLKRKLWQALQKMFEKA